MVIWSYGHMVIFIYFHLYTRHVYVHVYVHVHVCGCKCVIVCKIDYPFLISNISFYYPGIFGGAAAAKLRVPCSDKVEYGLGQIITYKSISAMPWHDKNSFEEMGQVSKRIIPLTPSIIAASIGNLMEAVV